MDTTITISVDADTAKLYTHAPADTQKKLQVLLGLWLREFAMSPRSLAAIMDEISQKAQERGLTQDLLDQMLNER